MKNLKITLITFICIFAFACKKEKIEDTTKAIYYKNSPNSLDNLMIEVNMPEKNSVAYFYGSSDSLGAPSTVNSISYKVNSNDTIVNFILDDEKRPQIIYFSNNSGTKLNQLIKFEYISSDSTIISIYNYNWQNNTDSLLFQSRGKGDKAIKTYGLRLNSTTDIGTDILLAFGATGLSIAAVALLPGILFAAAGYTLGQSALAGVITAATFIASNSHANQQLQTQTNPNAPLSPTSGFIPNPTGTPTNPTGNKGKVLFYALSCYSGCTGSGGVGTQIRVEIENSNHELVASGSATVRDYSTPIPANCSAGQAGDLVLTLPVGGYYTTVYVGSSVAYYSNVYITENGCNIVSL